MFVRKKKNRSGSISVQVIDKSKAYRVVKTIGSSKNPEQISRMFEVAKLFIDHQSKQYSLFPQEQQGNAAVIDFVRNVQNSHVRTVGPELIFGKIFDQIGFDEAKIAQAARWDGLKGYLTNTNHSPELVIETYGQLWHVEKAFRISKTDLRIRPMYHYRRRRIEAHVLIAFVAYTIYKELERRLAKGQLPISPQRAIELTQTMYELRFELPNDPEVQHVLLKMDTEQQMLYDLLY
jgi:transposase